ncbi:MAG: hypothetical protein V3V55_03020 [Rhodospirillales bacterium]
MAKSSKAGKGRKTAVRRQTAAASLTSAAALLRSFPSGKLSAKGKTVAGKPAMELAFEAMMKSARPVKKPAPTVIKVGASAKPRPAERQQAREEWVDIFDLSPWTNMKSLRTGVVRRHAPHRTVRKHGVGAVLAGDMVNPWLSSSESSDAASQPRAEETPPVEGEPGETASDDELDMDQLRKQLTRDFGREAIRELQLGGPTNPDKVGPMTPKKDETKTKTGTGGVTAAPSKPSDWQTPAAAANAGKQAAAKAGKRAAAKVGKQAAQAKPVRETAAAAQAKPARKAAPETTSRTAKAKPPEQEEIPVESLFKEVASLFCGVVSGLFDLTKKAGKRDKADDQ